MNQVAGIFADCRGEVDICRLVKRLIFICMDIWIILKDSGNVFLQFINEILNPRLLAAGDFFVSGTCVL